MFIEPTNGEPTQEDVDTVVSNGPGGALTLAGIALFIVVAIWFAFYFFVFVPRA
ncbi:MAG TPA: hypothetical protein VFS17_08400 [Methylophilaceae bacterium]|nr:hypothetical protein [Methylophilaceae bacterium]